MIVRKCPDNLTKKNNMSLNILNATLDNLQNERKKTLIEIDCYYLVNIW